MKKYVKYLRVSTDRQGETRNGLEAQNRALDFACAGGHIVTSFTEVHSGGDLAGCVELQKAIALCKANDYILAVYNTDRFRNVHEALGIIKELGKDNILFANMPTNEALPLTIGLAFAQQEKERIGSRTKAGLKSVQNKGVKLGAANNKYGANTKGGKKALMDNLQTLGVAAIKEKAKTNPHNMAFVKLVGLLKITEYSQLDWFLNFLNEMGYKTASGMEFNMIRLKNMIINNNIKLNGKNKREAVNS